jgi:predicted PurR-regulated permease PerM
MIKQYITGLIIQIIIVSVLTSILLSILGIKYAVLLGVLTGILNVIPYLGISISALIACFISFATGEASYHSLRFLGYIGVHVIDGNLILRLL